MITKVRATERERDAKRKREIRSAGNDLRIPKIKNPARKRRCERDVFLWLKTYLPDDFKRPFTDDRRKMINEILYRATHGGKKSIAAARSDGKTTSAEGVILFCMLMGILRFPVIVSATGPDAGRVLKHIKNHLERNPVLAEDYPEVCYPIWQLDGAPQRAGTQTVCGKRTYLEWSQEHIVLPTVFVNGKKTRASGAVLATRGLDAAIRGLKVGNQRPDFVLFDDPETRESVKSEEQTKTRRLIIEEDCGGLGANDDKMGFVMLTTIMKRLTNEGSPTISFEYTDPKLQPSWDGLRFRQLVTYPDRMDLWEENMRMRRDDHLRGDRDARRSHQHYLDNQQAMDAGAIVSNPYRFIAKRLPDGTQTEASALQSCFNIIADRGQEHFDTEYQNNPPEEDSEINQLILTAHHIQHACISGLERRVVPQPTVLITTGVDVRKLGLHWVAIAWNAEAVGAIVDYDFFEFVGTANKPARECESLILEGLYAFREARLEHPFVREDGQECTADLTLIDMGWKEESWNQQPVQVFCNTFGNRDFMAAKGLPNYRRPRESRHILIGDNWHIAWPNGLPIVETNPDHWKLKVHEGFQAEPGTEGSLALFKHPLVDGTRVNRNIHLSYAKHILAETWTTRAEKGFRRQRLGWWGDGKPNHYFDATYEALVARSVRGLTWLNSTTVPASTEPSPVNRSAETSLPTATEQLPSRTRYY